MLIQKAPNVHIFNAKYQKKGKPNLILIASDIHFDNPKCDRDLLKKHFDEAIKKGARILMPGDTFCLMQGKYDPRGSKSDILPQHNVSNYIDAVIEEAVDWFAPYAENIDVVGYGNHETSILKRLETNVLERFAFGINSKAKTKSPVMVGGYGGWYITNIEMHNAITNYKIKYFHGSGGGAPVTKGKIQHNRMATQVHGADAIVMGHVHNDYEHTYAIEKLDKYNRPIYDEVLMVRTSTYKDEYFNLKKGVGSLGWHVERGGGPKPLGGRWLEIHTTRRADHNGKRVLRTKGRTYKTL